ncbi:MAG: tyrosine-type recombinase/integrase [Candidatus Buchananbacteria bacterium]|nr:tyrosine-type recombinase/integrase [Candidatus Buchananbacteria bacterium]
MNNKNIKELFDDFIKQCRYITKLSESSIDGYNSTFELLLKIYPDLTVEMLTPALMTEFFEKLEKRARIVGRNKTVKVGIKSSTVATYRSKLNKFFNWLVSNGYLKSDPFGGMAYPDVDYDDKKFLRKEELEKIVAAISTRSNNLLVRKRDLAMFYTLLYCGLRRGELIGLKVYDINLEKREMTVAAETSKSKNSRIIPIHLELVTLFKDYLAERKKLRYQTSSLFVSNNRDAGITFNGLKHFVDNIKNASGVNFHLHQLRHTFAVNLLNNHSDIAKLKQLMGHRDIRMTASYLRCLPTESMRADVESLRLDKMCWRYFRYDSEDVCQSATVNVRQKRPNK